MSTHNIPEGAIDARVEALKELNQHLEMVNASVEEEVRTQKELIDD